MNLKEIVKEWLAWKGFDGLFNSYGCACELDDLMPCGEVHTDCCSGYKVACPEGHKHDFTVTVDLNLTTHLESLLSLSKIKPKSATKRGNVKCVMIPGGMGTMDQVSKETGSM